MEEELKPCPFCGAGETIILANKGVWTGRGYGAPSSVEAHHWCTEDPGQPSRMISRIGRDEASAIAAWNRRPTIAAPAQELTTPNTLGGFRGGFIGTHGHAPTEQEIWNAGVRSGMNRAAPAQEPKYADLCNGDAAIFPKAMRLKPEWNAIPAQEPAVWANEGTLKVIAKLGSGSVYLSRDREDDQTVALYRDPASTAAPVVPEGWQIVPKKHPSLEPGCFLPIPKPCNEMQPSDWWDVLLAAAPKPDA